MIYNLKILLTTVFLQESILNNTNLNVTFLKQSRDYKPASKIPNIIMRAILKARVPVIASFFELQRSGSFRMCSELEGVYHFT